MILNPKFTITKFVIGTPKIMVRPKSMGVEKSIFLSIFTRVASSIPLTFPSISLIWSKIKETPNFYTLTLICQGRPKPPNGHGVSVWWLLKLPFTPSKPYPKNAKPKPQTQGVRVSVFAPISRKRGWCHSSYLGVELPPERWALLPLLGCLLPWLLLDLEAQEHTLVFFYTKLDSLMLSWLCKHFVRGNLSRET